MKHSNAGRCLVALLSVLMAGPATAGEARGAEPGERVRVTAAAPGLFQGIMTGTLLKIGPDTLTLVDPKGGAITEMPLASINRLEVSHGRRRRTRAGLLIGAAAGLALAPFMYSDNSMPCGDTWNPRPCTQGERTGIAVFMVAVLAGEGAWLGHKKVTEEWRDTAVPRVKVSVRPEHGGAGVALTLGF
jgi:hypothetical protein